MKPRKVGMVSVVVMCSLLLVGGCSSGSKAESGASTTGGLTTVKFGFLESTTDLAFGLPEAKQIFAADGINLVLSTSGGTAASVIPSVLHNSLQMSVGSTTSTVLAIAQGAALTLIAGGAADVNTPYGGQHAVLVRPNSGIHTYADLAGKTVAVPALNDGFDLTLRTAVEKAGGDASSVKRIELPYAEALTALKSGEVDAVTTLEPYTAQGLAQGDVNLGDPNIATIGEGAQVASVFAGSAWADKNPVIVAHALKAMSTLFSYSSSHPAELRALLAKYLGESDAAVAKIPLPKFVVPVSDSDISIQLKMLVSFGLVKTSDVPPVSKLVYRAP